MPTNPNMVAIQTVTVGAGGIATIEFTSIPQTYTDLLIKVSARSTHSSIDPVFVTFNGTATSTTSYRSIFGDGATAASYNGTGAQIQYIPGTGQTANTFNNAEIYIPNYTGSNNKSFFIDTVQETNAATAYIVPMACLWSNTSAITSIMLDPATGNFAQYSTATLYGLTSAAVGAKATGGIITSDADYYYHTFLASGTFTPTQNLTADYLVVAGGGAGGGDAGGGGGAGGLRSTVTATGGGGSLESPLALLASTGYTVTVGAGGTGSAGAAGGAGNNSVFSTITSTGGGGGGRAGVGNTGGSGGGGSGRGQTTGTNPAGGAGTANQGYAGGAGAGDSSVNSQTGGGGGGAGAVGANSAIGTGGNGGTGVATSISGSSVTYAGGGGGGFTSTGTNGSGGSGGGGSSPSNAGTANTGGGGGGGTSASTTGGNGGSGIVIVRYAR